MYAQSGLFAPYFQNFCMENQQLEEYCNSYQSDSPMSNLVQTPAMVDYDFDYDYGAESDLFRAPETIIEEPIDPIVGIFSCSEDVVSSQTSSISHITQIQREQQLLNEAFYACKKDLVAQSVMDSQISEGLDIKVPLLVTDETQIGESKVTHDVALPKSESSGSLSSMELMQDATMNQHFLDFSAMDLGAVYGMRRAYSEGDIKTLCNTTTNSICNSALEWVIGNCTSEERKEKLSRYKNKKTKRNFGRKIKYACRKALADSQPRIRGRFARTEESDSSKR